MSVLLQRLGRLAPPFALALCAASTALLLLSGYQLLHAAPGISPLPNFMRQLRLPPAPVSDKAPDAAALRARDCRCQPARHQNLQVREEHLMEPLA